MAGVLTAAFVEEVMAGVVAAALVEEVMSVAALVVAAFGRI
jgi:hypothetical protein